MWLNLQHTHVQTSKMRYVWLVVMGSDCSIPDLSSVSFLLTSLLLVKKPYQSPLLPLNISIPHCPLSS